MKNECSVVRDILPLYFENMLSEDTAAFVKEHLESCSECSAEFETIKAGKEIETNSKIQSNTEEDMLNVLKSFRRKFRRKLFRAAAVTAAILLIFGILLHYFPVYRITEIGSMWFGGYHYYTNDEIAKALYIGSSADRAEAQSVLRLADKAFNDIRHTRAENEEAYGLLARYATSTDSYGDTAFNEHSLELWSAHLDGDMGWIWVYYSSETFNHDGSTARGSWRIPSLWIVEKNDSGEWVVVKIREHP